MCYLCSRVMFDRMSKRSGRILAPGILKQRKHLASVLAVLNKLTDGTNTWTREKTEQEREREWEEKGGLCRAAHIEAVLERMISLKRLFELSWERTALCSHLSSLIIQRGTLFRGGPWCTFTRTSVRQEPNETCPSLTITSNEPEMVCLRTAVRMEVESCLQEREKVL